MEGQKLETRHGSLCSCPLCALDAFACAPIRKVSPSLPNPVDAADEWLASLSHLAHTRKPVTCRIDVPMMKENRLPSQRCVKGKAKLPHPVETVPHKTSTTDWWKSPLVVRLPVPPDASAGHSRRLPGRWVVDLQAGGVNFKKRGWLRNEMRRLDMWQHNLNLPATASEEMKPRSHKKKFDATLKLRSCEAIKNLNSQLLKSSQALETLESLGPLENHAYSLTNSCPALRGA